MQSKLIFALTLSASLAAGTALAQQGRSPPAAPAPKAVDQTLGMAIMSALVSNAGGLIEGAGAVSSVRNNIGVYAVKFNRALAGCVNTATVWGDNAFSAISTRPQGDIVYVSTNNSANGQPRDETFQLIVFCSK